MNASADRLEFAPPPQPGTARAFVLAVIAHLLLMIALTWGINWNRESENMAAEAELWSAVPQQAAPKLVEPPAPPAAAAAAGGAEESRSPAAARAHGEGAGHRPGAREEEAGTREAARARAGAAEEARGAQEAGAGKARAAGREAKAAEDRKKQEELAKAAKDKSKQLADAKRREALRQENLKRMQGLAGATGGSTSTGTALRSAGPSDSYAGRIRARVRPNIVFTDDIAGNPTAEVEVRMAPDGTITSSKIVKSSGVKSWDNAVLRALDKTETLPRDTDGRVHTPLIIEFRPKG